MVLELEEDSSGRSWGVMYLRGFEKNMVIGCDYLVVGFRKDDRVSLAWQKVIRQVNLNSETCGWLRSMTAIMKSGKQGQALEGNWYSQNYTTSHFVSSRTSGEISSSSQEEMAKYADELFTYFENNGFYLPPDERKVDPVAEVVSDSAELALEIRSRLNRSGDSISIYLDGEKAISQHDISSKPLRLKIQLPDSSGTQVVFVNESLQRHTLKLTLSWIVEGKRQVLDIQPSHSRNLLFIIQRRKVIQ